ncbi:LOW QUALITY PROTEIN: putative late blight resistance protein homolog R1A-3 [Lycium ferocissimum]|uniref:LOW QUALITY PROTEIN: putative late blight resistance protein homolog R1A-3 n=1 Tax=Lycium ferocissimum TaxID=112874 RepID=UPI002815DB1D|nr:LOW QUALITY PROTEIN: putative late blight resistance protein homolog R1A-3 [Lycium ferocissimum]
MAKDDIDDVLDHLRRIKRRGDLSRVDEIAEIELLELELRLLRTFIKYHHLLLPDSLVKITKKVQLVGEMLHSVFDGNSDECKTNLNVERLVSQLLKFVKGNTSSVSIFELNDSDLLEYMDFLGKNLNDVLMWLELDASNPSSADEQILQYNRSLKQVKMIQKKMRFLRYLYVTEINGFVDHQKLEGLQTRMQFMVDNVGQFCLAIFVLKDSDDTNIYEVADDILSKLPYLLGLIVLVELEMKKIFLGELKASKFTQSRTFKDKKLPKGFSHHLHSLLMYLRNQKLQNFPNSVSAQNIDVAIEFLLVFLDADVSNPAIYGNWLNEVMEKVGAIAGDVLYVIQKLLPRSINEDDTSKINICSIQILEKTKDLNAQVETYYKSLKFTPSQFPMVGGLSFLDSVLRKLNGMSKSESGLVFEMKPDISNLVKKLSSVTSILEKELSSLSSIFRDVAKVHHEHENLKDLQRRTINLAYEAEVAIDSILAHYNAFWHIFCSLPTILKEIKHIKEEVTEMWSADVALKPYYVIAPTKHLPTQHSNSVNDEEVVGFEIAADKLIQYLTRGTSELDVIPIVGMGGQGKTTCARKLYNNDIIVSHFDIQAWCIISQTYNRKELLREIFSQVTGSKDEVGEVGELADKLRKSLMGKRYLIVLDDMWDGMAWDDLSLCFPDVGNRSRIIVTTRLEKVGEHVMRHTDPYTLPFLTPAESCSLLQKKVFQQEGCPTEFQDVSLAVAKRCKGLPLVIILVAGIIKKKKREASWWHDVKKSLLSYLGESEGYSLSTMKLSYDNLPDYLRPCLLYMGMFPEDARIPVSKLISLWIAEGFLQNIESGRSMEEAAEDYLMDLISSNVVMVSKRRYNGKVKDCQVHDVVLHFCLEKSREEKFMLAVKGHYSQLQPSYWDESRVSFTFSEELSDIALLGSKTHKPFRKYLRSLITTNHGVIFYQDFFNQFNKLRLVKVLDLSSCEVDPLSLATLNPLIHLKYLAVKIEAFRFHPESHLLHLETLIVKRFFDNSCIKLPANFWKMEKLRHVEINNAYFDLEKNKQGIFEESSKLENLRILRNVSFPIDDADSVDVLLGRCPNLQELEINFGRNDSVEISLKLESLTQLQILRLYIKWSYKVLELQLPSNLRELVLTGTLIESTIPIIAKLPNLESLQLAERKFTLREEWCLGDITFPKLKFLKLVELYISRWDASEASFPLLETLVIKKCIYLEEIPLSFADIPTLKQIKLIGCNKSLEASAVKIKEEVEEIEGCDRIDLII